MTLVPSNTPDAITADWRRGGGLLGRWRRRREIRELDELAVRLGWCWEDTVHGANLVHHSKSAAGIPHSSAPRVRWVEGGPPLTLIVRMLPGQVVDDFRAQAHRLAEGMGVSMVRVSSERHGWLRVALLVRDPLTTPMPLPPRQPGTSAGVPGCLAPTSTVVRSRSTSPSGCT